MPSYWIWLSVCDRARSAVGRAHCSVGRALYCLALAASCLGFARVRAHPHAQADLHVLFPAQEICGFSRHGVWL
jgi:hypothetical protein